MVGIVVSNKMDKTAVVAVERRMQHPLYKKITSQPAPIGGDITWNFQKYLVDGEGNLVAKFSPGTEPDDPALVGKIEELLGSASP